MDNSKRYSYNRFGKKGQRVGQAVADILSKEQPTYTAGEILDGYSQKFVEEIQSVIEKNQGKYTDPFYIFVLTKKEMWADNVVRNWFIARQTRPSALEMMSQYSNHTKTLYKVDSRSKEPIQVEWSLPGFSECISILKSPGTYDPELVRWILKCFEGKLDQGVLAVA